MFCDNSKLSGTIKHFKEFLKRLTIIRTICFNELEPVVNDWKFFGHVFLNQLVTNVERAKDPQQSLLTSENYHWSCNILRFT